MDGKQKSSIAAAADTVTDITAHSKLKPHTTMRQTSDKALLGASLVLLATMVGVPRLDAALTVALFGFAVAMPLLAGDYYIASFDWEGGQGIGALFVTAMTYTSWGMAQSIGQLAAIVGIVAYVWHLAQGAVFASFVAIMATVIALYVILFTIVIQREIQDRRSARVKEGMSTPEQEA